MEGGGGTRLAGTEACSGTDDGYNFQAALCPAEMWHKLCAGTTVDTICGNAVANNVCACVCACVHVCGWSPLQSIALKSSSSEGSAYHDIAAIYDICSLYI